MVNTLIMETSVTKSSILNRFTHLPVLVVVDAGVVVDNPGDCIKDENTASIRTSMTGTSEHELNNPFTPIKYEHIRRRTFTASQNLQTQTTTGSFADGQYLHSELFDVSKRSRKYLGD